MWSNQGWQQGRPLWAQELSKSWWCRRLWVRTQLQTESQSSGDLWRRLGYWKHRWGPRVDWSCQSLGEQKLRIHLQMGLGPVQALQWLQHSSKWVILILHPFLKSLFWLIDSEVCTGIPTPHQSNLAGTECNTLHYESTCLSVTPCMYAFTCLSATVREVSLIFTTTMDKRVVPSHQSNLNGIKYKIFYR